ncbi:radical SAM protein [archaeon]|nr:radical SAM protein [archaeon]MBT4396755.1 radical SAM protein [archaeon]MBT4441365.1 radical SAM protein [archaeon]
MPKNVYLESNGCAVIRHDTQRYAKYFRLNGWDEVDNVGDADLVLYTTCGVIDLTEEFALEAIDRIKGELRDGSKLIVGGCLPKINPERLIGVFDGVSFGPTEEVRLDDLIGANVSINDVFWDGEIVREHSMGDPELAYSPEELEELEVVDYLSGVFKDRGFLEIYNYLTKGRFFWQEDGLFEVKVGDGCMYNCAYCGTKNAKGNLVSRDPGKIIEEFKFGVERGFPKILLTGDEVGEYGRDRGSSLVELLRALIPESRDSRIALRYVSPSSLVRQYNDLAPLFDSGNVYYFCSSIQSGSPDVLKLMRRPKDIGSFLDLVAKIDVNFPGVYKHTQVIVGFPQETEEDFKMTMEAMERSGFDYFSVIRYSRRPNTLADGMDGHLDPEVIEERFQRAKSLASEIRSRKLRKRIFDKFVLTFKD